MNQQNPAGLSAQLQSLLLEKYEPIAICGIGVRAPGNISRADAFAAFLRDGGDGIGDIPLDRWNNAEFFAEDDQPGAIRTRRGGYLSDITGFDSKFFNISPKEAPYIDPQQRLVLECAWEALEHAGVDPDAVRGGNGGVFVGVSSIDYSLEVGALPIEQAVGAIGTGTAHSAVSGRVSYFLGWRGPCVSIDTACSSSLVALHQAIWALRHKECDIALCGGVNAIHHPRNLVIFSDAKMLSPSGQCKTFDDSADGYGRSEGCAMVVLKRLSDAIADGDDIVALLRGSAVGQDGESGGLTVPNGLAQERVMRCAIENAALSASDIGYVEAHGTGTSLGDPIEVKAIHNVFANRQGVEGPVLIGSVKANIGHTEAAAGILGVVKAALQLSAGEVFPHIGMKVPSSKIPWGEYQVEVPTAGRKLQGHGHRALVNSFGFAGTISSVVLEQAPMAQTVVQNSPTGPAVLTLSAKSRTGLLNNIAAAVAFLREHPELDPGRYCRASNHRSHFVNRVAHPGPFTTSADLASWLEKKASSLRNAPDRATPCERVAFVFPGQGAQYLGMGQGLYHSSSVFQQALDRCDAEFSKYLGQSIKAIIFAEHPQAEELLNQTQFTQPALFAVEYALACYWLRAGLRPATLIGHSIGEVVAACVAKLFSFEDAVKLVAHRSRLMGSITEQGGMLAVEAREAELQALLASYGNLDIAAVNGPTQCVVSGMLDQLASLKSDCEAAGIETRTLAVSHAFHSYQMRSIFDEFRAAIMDIKFRDPEITLISNISGEVASLDEIGNADYWIRHIGDPVRFSDGVLALAARGNHVCLETGPGRTLSNLGRQSAPELTWINSLSRAADDSDSIASALAAMYQAGLKLDWTALHGGKPAKLNSLPFYQFDRKPYWLNLDPAFRVRRQDARVQVGHPLLGAIISLPGEAVVAYQNVINAYNPPYLADHKVFGQVIFPGAGYVEMLVASQWDIFGEVGGSITNLRIFEPLYLTEERTELSTRCVPRGDGAYEVSIASRMHVGSRQIEKIHATAVISAAGDVIDQGLDVVPNPAASNCRTLADRLYGDFEQIGLNYGDAFQRIVTLEVFADGVARANLHNPASFDDYIGAALLDGAMQAIAGLLERNRTFLPVEFEKVTFLKRPRGVLQATLRKVAQSESLVHVDLVIRDANRPVCVVRGLKLKAVEAKAPEPGNEIFHAPRWEKRSLIAGVQDRAPKRALAIGGPEILVGALQRIADGTLELCTCRSGDEAHEILSADSAFDHILYLCPRERDAEALYGDLLPLIQRLDKPEFQRLSSRLWLVTETAQIVEAADVDAADTVTASLWGFGHTLLNEYPRWQTTLLDVASLTAPDTARSLLAELTDAATGADYQIAYRGGNRYVRRLLPVKSQQLTDADFELRVTEYGLFEHVRPVPVTRSPVESGEIEVEVHAAGLNFKDVLNALGLLKQHADEQRLPYVELPLGFEGAGIVTQVGAGSRFTVGDRVLLSHLGCFRRRVVIPEQAAVPMPVTLSFSQAAALPTAFITAHYALHYLAGIRSGDRVLIHCAAGGVGQAAVQIAKAAGAEIFATASPGKWDLLKSQGIKHIMNSRTLDFSSEVMRLTGGQGVDVIVNSLNKEFVKAGVDCLAPRGRFVELGKIGIWTADEMARYRPDVQYRNFDLSEFDAAESLRINSEILKQVAEGFNSGHYHALPISVYGVEEVAEAFSVLSRGANRGKIVLQFIKDAPPAEPITISPERIYLVTGGYGALGQVVARKLGEWGATHIALCGRSAPPTDLLERLQGERTVTYYFLQGDVADAKSVHSLARQLAETGVPVGGVFHTAGVLNDAPIKGLDLAGLNRVFAAKVAGTDNLLQWLDSIGSDAFVVGFSSIASLVGSISQANYAAANSYLDYRLARGQRLGRRCLSVNWGPWAEIGMAANLPPAIIAAVEEKGIKFLNPRLAMRSLYQAMGMDLDQVAVGKFDWSAFGMSLSAPNALYSKLLPKTEARAQLSFAAEQYVASNRAERLEALSHFIRRSISLVLHYDDIEEIEAEAKFADLGLDSLVAVELKNSMERALKFPLLTSLIFDYPSIPALAEYLYGEIWPVQAHAPDDDASAVAAMSASEVDAELDALMQ